MAGYLASAQLEGPLKNRPEQVKLCLDQEKALMLLRLHGIPVRRMEHVDEVTPQRRFMLLVFQHKVLQMLKMDQEPVWLHDNLIPREQEEFEALTGNETEQEIKIAKYLAVRSIYALGLEYGLVTIGAYSPKRLKVMHVSPVVPRNRLIVEAMEEFADQELLERESPPVILLGADPEFVLRNQAGKMVMASRFLTKKGMVGYDAARYREEISVPQYPIAELRPTPAEEPGELFRNLYQTMRLAKKKITDSSLQWLAGGMPFAGYPIGGHLHFSGVRLTFSLLRKLDAYLMLPLALIEDQGCRMRRPRYGFFGDFREKPHGGFEYRTLPSWLISPRITKGVFALAKVIVEHYRSLRYDFSLDVRMQRAYYQGDKEEIAPAVQRMWSELKKLPIYQTYQQDLEPFFQLLLSGQEWRADEDLRIAWKLAP
ncbi:putative amidoligase domain-containing protein [Brevibacillus migulae]|uniref:putative amidoligase domain-containing protein n=1 Tax=Brevibacillus migulae TaxID=1644114 RepID=UPI00142FE301|nr:hypothetical protein [Brevibacillus migulae]